MNLENIREGIRVPNYRKLCELLEEKAEAGNSKNAQLRKWNQFFSYQREGNAYIITEIHAVPRTMDDKLEGELPSPINPPEGCRFQNRCKYACDRCRCERPELKEVEPGHWVACHLMDK